MLSTRRKGENRKNEAKNCYELCIREEQIEKWWKKCEEREIKNENE